MRKLFKAIWLKLRLYFSPVRYSWDMAQNGDKTVILRFKYVGGIMYVIDLTTMDEQWDNPSLRFISVTP
jgi:hypothetical protein